MKFLNLLFLHLSFAENGSGYTLMRENVSYFCYDDFLMQTSLERSQADCLEFCASVYDPEDDFRPAGPFNYALYAKEDGACFCQTLCYLRHLPDEFLPGQRKSSKK
ncbi:Oidioi.mRNA.OKI2018_I69.chr1.g578.t1.cds [Oikopleura dioica]|uniref:Oidioi.mRNA.OKI2018_I69.chr1.g578.t1.cds n=1 Tax=Oikopleura dioica TaxID=34765 RepID=A0ABN7SK98_OIKDI|nr:Oidioi.mRNA.OKI2018_I69.chr1.g578.t1.cds [Oikopleura dioica]